VRIICPSSSRLRHTLTVLCSSGRPTYTAQLFSRSCRSIFTESGFGSRLFVNADPDLDLAF
jgi:hypothetical protein